MDRWKRAYTYLGIEALDRGRERLIVYGTAAVFWVNLATWLITRSGIVPGVDGPLEWLLLALLAIPGTAKAAFLIALGPIRQGEWETSWVNPDPERTRAPLPVPAEMIDTGEVPDPDETPPSRKWWRLRAKLRSEFTRRQRPRRRPRGTRPWTPTWSRPGTATQATQQLTRLYEPPQRHAVAAQARPKRGGSAAGTLVKILVGLTLFAVCGGFWLTGGNIVSPSDSTTEPPRSRSLSEKRHMLEIINQARTTAGVPPVRMGTNNVAQIQAENLLRDCVLSHWGTDGLKPYMRYSLAGGYQTNGENALTFNECGLSDTLLQWNDDPTEMVEEAVKRWLDSPGHRETMLGPSYRRVNIGLAWDRNTFKAIQHFEGDYVELSQLPEINDGELTLVGTLEGEYEFEGSHPMIALIIYDPGPRTLTQGQLLQTSCYSLGETVAAIIPPSPLFRSGYEYTESVEGPQCTDPYRIGSDAESPETREEIAEVWDERRERSEQIRETELSFPVMKAENLTVDGSEFTLTADVSEILDEHGPGVYSVALLAELEGIGDDEHEVISEYSIFHEVRAPRTYSNGG